MDKFPSDFTKECLIKKRKETQANLLKDVRQEIVNRVNEHVADNISQTEIKLSDEVGNDTK